MLQMATAISDEARAKYHEYIRHDSHQRYQGLTFWSPNINLFRDPRWGRGQETYGEDPFLTGTLGVQFVRGLQGDDPKYLKTVATVKHFAVHSGPEPERHTFDAVVSERDLRETYLPHFEMAIRDRRRLLADVRLQPRSTASRRAPTTCCSRASCAASGASRATSCPTAARSTTSICVTKRRPPPPRPRPWA